MTEEVDALLKRFGEIKAAEAEKPTTEQVDAYTALYDDLARDAKKKMAGLREVITKARHRKTMLKMKSKILKLAVEPGHMIITDRRRIDDNSPATEWFHVDEVRGKKGYVFRGRLITIINQPKVETASNFILIGVRATSMRATEAAGWSWGTPKPVSSVLGELVSTGMNLMHLLDATQNLELDKRTLFAFNKEKGWIVIPNQVIKKAGYDYAAPNHKKITDRQLDELDYWDMRNDDILGQIKVEWPNEKEQEKEATT